MKTWEAARGRWREILPALGVAAANLDGRHHPCPCGTASEDAFRFSDLGRGAYFCKCSGGEKNGIALVQCALSCDYATACRAVDRVIGHTGKREAPRPAPIQFDLCHTSRSKYLEARGLEMAPGLRWTRHARYYRADKTNTDYAAMLAPISDAAGKFATWHVTYLDNGTKANETSPRKIMPGLSWHGGACILYPAEGPKLGVAEGIETAIAAKMLHGLPVWAAIDMGNLAKFVPPEHVTELVIFADSDENLAGHVGAYSLAHRLRKMGRVKVSIQFPRTSPGDFNDDLLNRNLMEHDDSG